MARTEEQIIAQEPLTIVLGAVTYEVRLLTIKESREWRRQVAAALSVMPNYTKAAESTDPEQFKATLTGILEEMPETVADLFFGYAKELDRKVIEDAATDAELARAFDQVMAVGFPLVKALIGAMGRISQ